MSTPLHAQILGAINSVRPYLYGAGLKILLLQMKGTNVQYDELIELDKDFIISFDRSGNLTLMLSSDQFDEAMKSATHVVFDGWIYQLTEPAKPRQGPFPMWKATGRHLGSKYVAEP